MQTEAITHQITHLGSHNLGERGSLKFSLHSEIKNGEFVPSWSYPIIDLETHSGESANINLQHMSSKQLNSLADFIKKVAFKLEAVGL